MDDFNTVKIFSGLPTNQPHVAADDSYSTEDDDDPLSVAAPGVLGNDSDPDGDSITAILVTDPLNGTVALSADGSFSYVPNDDVDDDVGTDSFTYMVSDGTADNDVATVTITLGDD